MNLGRGAQGRKGRNKKVRVTYPECLEEENRIGKIRPRDLRDCFVRHLCVAFLSVESVALAGSRSPGAPCALLRGDL